MMSEKSFEIRIKEFLKSRKIWYTKIWGGGFQKAGIPDILACCNGKFIAIEVKSHYGKASPLQLAEIDNIKKAGGIALILHPQQFEDFKKMIEELINEV